MHTAQSNPADSFSGALPNLPLQVKGRTLLWMMAVVPLCVLAAMIDSWVFNGALRNYSITNPLQVVWWVAILSTPHIIASLVTFADREYIHHYSKYLVRGSVVALALGVGLPFVAGYMFIPPEQAKLGIEAVVSYGSNIALVVAAAYTTYHNLQQQYGIALMLMREKPAFIHHLWKWMTIVPASLVFVGMNFTHMGQQWQLWPTAFAVAAVNMLLAIGIAATIITRYMKKPGYSKTGLAYFCANASMIAACFGLAFYGHILIAIVMTRLVHDFTSYWIYMVHDENRNADCIRNPVYALPRKIGISPALFCIPLSFVVGFFLLQWSGANFIISIFVISLNYIHYYLEGIVWKRGTPHRQHVPFT